MLLDNVFILNYEKGEEIDAEWKQTGAAGSTRSWSLAAFLIVESNTVSGCEKLPPRPFTRGILNLNTNV